MLRELKACSRHIMPSRRRQCLPHVMNENLLSRNVQQRFIWTNRPSPCNERESSPQPQCTAKVYLDQLSIFHRARKMPSSPKEKKINAKPPPRQAIFTKWEFPLR